MGWREHFKDLRIETLRVALVVGDDALVDRLGDVAAEHVTPMNPTPFRVTWDHLPAEERKAFIVGRQAECWDTFSLEGWRVPLVVCVDGVPVGEVLLSGQRFREARTFGTAGWLGEPWRGQGLGFEMRRAALQFGFGALSADRAITQSFSDNAAALAVTKRLKYDLSGASLYVGGGNTGRRLLHHRLGRRKWESYVRSDRITMEGMCHHFP
jgi:RimJ/RimL family protein N-acetyltransferase